MYEYFNIHYFVYTCGAIQHNILPTYIVWYKIFGVFKIETNATVNKRFSTWKNAKRFFDFASFGKSIVFFFFCKFVALDRVYATNDAISENFESLWNIALNNTFSHLKWQLPKKHMFPHYVRKQAEKRFPFDLQKSSEPRNHPRVKQSKKVR